jgi:CubicO group peptidase (beta-lactamase class C family)
MQPVLTDQLAAWAGEARERWSLPGLAVGILRDGEVVAVADGVCAVGQDERVDVDSRFRIASITKPFVATLAMTLVQDGLLALDEPPQGSPVDATVRQLLSHEGGLASEWPAPLDEVGESDDSLIRLCEGEPERLPVGPGELFSYCNVGYWLVGAALARASGTTFEEAMRDCVLEPLELRATGFEPERPTQGHEQVMPGSDEHRPADPGFPRVRRPSGGLWSSVDDLLRFASHHLGGPGPLREASVAEMQRPYATAPGSRIGLGWFLTRRGGWTTVEHPGSVAGYQSLLLLLPEKRAAFAALSNSSRGRAAIRDVLERLGLGPKPRPDRRLPHDELAAFAGRYVGQGFELEIVPDDGWLRLESAEVNPLTGETHVNPSERARPVGDREFEIVDGESRGDRFNFPRDGFVCVGPLATRVA